MNRKEAQELLTPFLAFANGETIEMQTTGGEWVVNPYPDFNPACKYRVKLTPEQARTEWINKVLATVHSYRKAYSEKELSSNKEALEALLKNIPPLPQE